MSYLATLPLNTSDISQSRLNIEGKSRSNIFPWKGQFSPQFVEAIIQTYAPRNARIFDPFCGSGTVLLEAAALGHSATGIELNPAAHLLARTYELCNLTLETRLELLDSVEGRLQEVMPRGWPNAGTQFGAGMAWHHASLIEIGESMSPDQQIIMRALVILADFFKDPDSKRIAKVWQKFRTDISDLPFTDKPIRAIHGDCRSPFQDGTNYDLVVTSPPYINVYNYHQQYRVSAEALGWDLLQIAKTEIGSNRKHRGNRFLTVIQYCLDIASTLETVRSSLKGDGRVILVLGRESKVRGVPFYNGEIAAELAVACCGFSVCMRQERVFTNRFGQKIFEDILHLKLQRETKSSRAARTQSARAVAEGHLRYGLKNATTSDQVDGLEDAIGRLQQVEPSPSFAAPGTASHSGQNNNGHAGTRIPHAAPGKAARNPGKRKASGIG